MAITEIVESITPERATRYLETMDANRTVRQSDVNYLVTQMRAGMWRTTHQGIAFDADGRLVDGQHRMWAVVESGVTVKIKVARGLTEEDVAVLDTGRPRSYADVAHYQGWSTDPLTASCARYLALGPTMRNAKVPAELLHGWYEFYKDGVDFALQLRLTTRPHTGKSITVPMAAPFAAAYYSVDAEVLTRFGAVIQTGQFDVEADRAAFTLRDAWLAGRLGRSPTDQYFKTEAALRAFVARRPIRTLQRGEAIHFVPPKLPVELRLDNSPTRKRKDTRELRSAA